jgi:hypothetical protein
MTDRGLLDGIGSLCKLTYLSLNGAGNLTSKALCKFLHQPSMSSIMSLDLSSCLGLNNEGLKGIVKRCDKLTYLHV